uniref:Lipoprotein n=1 Tax=uncultured bacterium contig00052 TaxID=1181536 RepID=A0A806JYT2_9BACT|nr:hypothetical protein [uncultured bacterium contig00052]
MLLGACAGSKNESIAKPAAQEQGKEQMAYIKSIGSARSSLASYMETFCLILP